MARPLRAWAINQWGKTKAIIYSTAVKLGQKEVCTELTSTCQLLSNKIFVTHTSSKGFPSDYLFQIKVYNFFFLLAILFMWVFTEVQAIQPVQS